MLDECPLELRSDFQQYYHLDLDELLGTFQFERIDVLARSLPIESRTVRRLFPQSRWGDTEHLLALIADNLAFLRYEQSSGRGGKPKPLPRPKPSRERDAVRIDARTVDALLFGKRA